MYDPQTVAHEIKSPFFFGKESGKGQLGMGRYRPTWFTIWHVDPERRGTGNRTDDSCGWFERGPKEYADAVNYILADKDAIHEIARSLALRNPVTGPYGHTYPRLSLSDTLAVCLMAARYLEMRRWWNGQNGKPGVCLGRWRKTFTRPRNVDSVAFDLALNPFDNLSSIDDPEQLLRLTAAALHRHFRPWWKHPRWHVHHWRIQWHWLQRLNRWLFERCVRCGRGYAWGYSPMSDWGGETSWHRDCLAPDEPDFAAAEPSNIHHLHVADSDSSHALH